MKTADKETKLYQIRAALADIERGWVEVNGRLMKPSQRYRFDEDPVAVIFNTNCPEQLRKNIQSIIRRYYP